MCSSFLYGLLLLRGQYLVNTIRNVWNCILHYEVHTFNGHLKPVSGLKPHPSAPCVISCSQDGTVRTWHLENMTECCRVDCGEGVLGMCSDFPSGNKLTSYSHHEIRMWAVNQLETHFATINSHVVNMFRVSCPNEQGPPARIVALAEDDGLRLLSPVSGQIVTILFPMFSSQMIHDVVYSLDDDLLFVLLKTGDILTFSGSTNPCSAQQLLVSSRRNKIHCIAMCTVVLDDGTSQLLVFAGQHSGDIALVYTPHSRLRMPLPCPSHDGHVIKLVGSCDPINLSADSTAHYALLSFGVDNVLNTWSIEVERSTNLSLKLQLSVSLEPGPALVCLLGTTLCMAMGNALVMHKLSPANHSDSRLVPASVSSTDLPLLNHQKEDDHSDTIISLVCSEELKLFATSSRDGLVKIWNENNQLVSELEFGDTLAAVCFANSRGDLLVGFQKHVCVVKADDYLTSNYLETTRGIPFNEREERPITFNPALEFWYDTSRVPSLPAEQELRDQLLEAFKPVTAHKKLATSSLQTIIECSSSEGCELRDKEGLVSADQLQSLVDKSLAQRISQQYSQILRDGDKQSEVSSAGLHASSSHLASLSYSTVSMSMLSLSQSSGVYSQTSSRPSFLDISPVSFSPLVQVTPLDSPSTKLPIAPDCLIPNSVIRAKIGYVPPVLTFPPPYKPPKLKSRVFLDTSVQTLNSHDSELNRTYCIEEDAGSNVSLVLSDEHSRDILTCVSSFELSEEQDLADSEDVVKKANDGRWFSSKSKTNVNCLGATTQLPGFLSGGFDAVEGLQSSNHPMRPDSTSRQSSYITDHSDYTQQSRLPSSSGLSRQLSASTITIEPNLEHRQQAQRVTLPSRGSSTSMKSSRHPSGQEPSLTSVLIPAANASTPTQERFKKRRRRSSLAGKSAKLDKNEPSGQSTIGGSRRYSMSKGGAPELPALNELDGLELLIQKICGMSWFPRNSLRATGLLSVDQVYSVLIGLLKVTQWPVFGEVCRALLELKKARALSDEQEMTFVLRLVDRQNETDSSCQPLRLEILRTLKQLGLGGKEVLYVILPLLTDSNLEVRKAAFGALRSITGIVRRRQLQRLLVDLGLLQQVDVDEDEVLGELAERVRNGLVKPPLKGCFTTSLRAPRTPVSSVNSEAFTPPPTHHILHPSQDPTHTPHMQVGFLTHNHPRYFVHPTDSAHSQVHHRRRTQAHLQTLSQFHSSSFNQARANTMGDVATDSMHKRVRVSQGPAPSRTNRSALQKLLMGRPQSFAQCPQALLFMATGDVNHFSHKHHLTTGLDYKWSEVYPVIKDSLHRGLPNYNQTATVKPTRCVERRDVVSNCVTNSMSRKLFQQLKNSSNQSLQRSTSYKSEVKKRTFEQHLVVKLPKLTCS